MLKGLDFTLSWDPEDLQRTSIPSCTAAEIWGEGWKTLTILSTHFVCSLWSLPDLNYPHAPGDQAAVNHSILMSRIKKRGRKQPGCSESKISWLLQGLSFLEKSKRGSKGTLLCSGVEHVIAVRCQGADVITEMEADSWMSWFRSGLC